MHEIGDRRAAIATAVGLAGPGDVLLVAGKGHETGQEVAGTVHPFDDRTVLREVLAADGGAGMIALTLAEVAELTGGALTGSPDATVTGAVTLDSRTVAGGDLFVAVPGERVDGTSSCGRRRRAGRSARSPRVPTTRCPASWWPTRSRRSAGWPPVCTPAWWTAAC